MKRVFLLDIRFTSCKMTVSKACTAGGAPANDSRGFLMDTLGKPQPRGA